MSEIESWEKLEEPPQFLIQMEKFGLIYIFDDLKKNIMSGWTLIYNLPYSLRLENLGDQNRANNELKSIQNFIEYYFAKEIEEDFNSRFILDKAKLEIYGDKNLLNRILLQFTKPNADTCKYTLEEFLKFKGYWNLKNENNEGDPFDLKFKYSSSGYELVIRNDYHSLHAYGEIVPANDSILPWLLDILKDLQIDFKKTDPCTLNIQSLNSFLYLTNLFRSKSLDK